MPRRELPPSPVIKILQKAVIHDLLPGSELLINEKKWNRQGDALSAEQCKLPIAPIETDLVFDRPCFTFRTAG